MNVLSRRNPSRIRKKVMCLFYALCFRIVILDIILMFGPKAVPKAELTLILNLNLFLLFFSLPITHLTYVWQLLATMLDDKSATAKRATPPHGDIVAAVYPGVLLLHPFLEVPRPKGLYPKLGFFAALHLFVYQCGGFGGGHFGQRRGGVHATGIRGLTPGDRLVKELV